MAPQAGGGKKKGGGKLTEKHRRKEHKKAREIKEASDGKMRASNAKKKLQEQCNKAKS